MHDECYTIFAREVVFKYALHTRLPQHTEHYVQVVIFIKRILRRPPNPEEEDTTTFYYDRPMQNTLAFFFHNIYLPQKYIFIKHNRLRRQNSILPPPSIHNPVSYTHLENKDIFQSQIYL